nr:radical SAM protein [Candidatus Freyarchaeota archaeon]
MLIKSSTVRESPDYLQMSLAAAMTLGFENGSFYRGAKLYCVNLLLTYEKGCGASCAYCGLSRARKMGADFRSKSFIRVDWPIYPLDEIVSKLNSSFCSHVERVCVSMVTNPRACEDALTVVKNIRTRTQHLISTLICPTVINGDWLSDLKECGCDKVGVAIDTATPELFDRLRGRGVNGPHKWSHYWDIIERSLEVFGTGNVGVHLMVGLDETESEMAFVIQRIIDMGARVHLFSFFPEPLSFMETHPQPSIGQYRRIQLVSHLISNDLTHFEKLVFNEQGQIIDFGLNKAQLDSYISEGKPFMTTGCPGKTLNAACNRPYANCTPFQAYMGELRNFPFEPNREDVEIIKRQVSDYSNKPAIPTLDRAEIFINDTPCSD